MSNIIPEKNANGIACIPNKNVPIWMIWWQSEHEKKSLDDICEMFVISLAQAEAAIVYTGNNYIEIHSNIKTWDKGSNINKNEDTVNG